MTTTKGSSMKVQSIVVDNIFVGPSFGLQSQGTIARATLIQSIFLPWKIDLCYTLLPTPCSHHRPAYASRDLFEIVLSFSVALFNILQAFNDLSTILFPELLVQLSASLMRVMSTESSWISVSSCRCVIVQEN